MRPNIFCCGYSAFPLVGDIVSPFLLGSRTLLRRRMRKVYERHSWVLDERRVEARHRPFARSQHPSRPIIRTVRGWNGGNELSAMRV